MDFFSKFKHRKKSKRLSMTTPCKIFTYLKCTTNYDTKANPLFILHLKNRLVSINQVKSGVYINECFASNLQMLAKTFIQNRIFFSEFQHNYLYILCSNERLIISRPSSNESITPSAFICIKTFPSTDPSIGPAITFFPVFLAVNSHNN